MALGAPPPPASPPLRFLIQFESTGKWPDDPGAIGALMTAFCLHLGKGLEAAHKDIACEVRAQTLYAQLDGFTFTGAIQHDPMLNLLRASGTPSGLRAAERLAWRTGEGARHTAALAALARAHPMYPPSARLAKRWVACQLYSHAIGDPLVELLAAQPFASPGERPPASAVGGFARFLRLLATFDFASEPLLLGLGGPITKEQRDAAHAAFAAARAAAGALDAGGETVRVGTSDQPAGAAACRLSPPSWQTFKRLGALAAAALTQMDRAVLVAKPAAIADAADAAGGRAAALALTAAQRGDGAAAPKDAAHVSASEADLGTSALMAAAFDVPAADFDALLELRPSALPSAHLSWTGGPAGAAAGGGGAKGGFANLKEGGVGFGVGQDPITALVGELEAAYGSLALFFCDKHGGRAVGVKWRPSAFLPAPLRAATAQHRTLIAHGAASEAAWALPNVAEALAGMAQLGGGLIKAVKLPKSSRAMHGAVQG